MNLIRLGNPLRSDLDRIETRIGELKSEIKQTREAPVPLGEMRFRIHSALEKLWSPNIAFRDFGSHDARFARLPDDDKTPALSLLVFCFGIDEILDRIMARVEAVPGQAGLPAAERAQRLADLQKEIDKLEVDSEREALRLEGQGYTILRRPDADAKAILRVWARFSDTPAAKAA